MKVFLKLKTESFMFRERKKRNVNQKMFEKSAIDNYFAFPNESTQ